MKIDNQGPHRDLRPRPGLQQRRRGLQGLHARFRVLIGIAQVKPCDRPAAFANQQFEQLIFALGKAVGTARQRDLDHTAIEFLQHSGIGPQFVVAGQAAGQRQSFVAQMLLHHGHRPAQRAGGHRLAEQDFDFGGLIRGGRAVHRILAHHPMAKRRERRQKADVDANAAALRGVHVFREGLPVPGQAALQHVIRNRLDVDQVHRGDLVLGGLARRQSHPAVAHDHRRHAMP